MNSSLLLFVIVVVIGCLSQLVSSAPQQKSSKFICYQRVDNGVHPNFATRTAYEFARGNISRPEASKRCKATQVWMLSRHGTRYPGRKSMTELLELASIRDRIIENHVNGVGELCVDVLEKLRDWQSSLDFQLNSAGELSSQGESDLEQLATRLQHAFPQLINRNDRNVRQGDYILRSTDKTRAQDSMRYFSYGLFGHTRMVVPFEKPPANDTLLLAHKHCPLWEADVKADPVLAEQTKFTKGPVMRSLIRDLSLKLGYSKDLKFKKIRLMYDMCRFESALYLNRGGSIWCSLFKENDFEIMEYREDLRHYYYSGPGRHINVKLGCQTHSDMFKHLKNVATEQTTSEPKGVFRFAHTVTLQALMSALGVNKEVKPLLAEDYPTSQNRNYRSSRYGPFASNVVAVSYRCDENSSSRFKVSIHVNEKLIEFPGCKDGLCDWSYLEKMFHSYVQHCTMDFCYK